MAVQDPKHPAKLVVTFAGIYGATLLASMVNLCLYGVGLLMVLQYFGRTAKRDPLLTRVLIVILIVLATLHAVFSCHQVYDLFITKHGNEALLDVIVFSVTGRWLTGYLTAFFAQVFFCCCIWDVGRRMATRARFLVVPAVAFALMSIGAGVGQTSIMITSRFYTKLTMRTGILLKTTAIQGAGAVAADLIISSTLCYIFHSHRSTLKSTNSMINKLITYAINRAIATSVCAVLSVALYFSASGTYYFLLPLLANTNLYLISAVSMLTSREGLREQADPSFHLTNLELSTAAGGQNASHSDTSAHTTSGLGLRSEKYGG
ncbi:hypothetical protein CPB83DRAFT_896199 [Crepidotus variabilis]|uniref:DUF6534 domain-containing protein n=1 Tax=Crepidotus variabilis TaxID=179855 RepID=A0A9P6ECD2_9AGAR|nr:hypothetical protein CPB83DRAFT_896199 [Crepidotus variabilis]